MSAPTSSPARSRSRSHSAQHGALALDRNPDGPVPAGHVGRRVADGNETYHPTLRVDLDDGAIGVVGSEDRSIRRAQAHEARANRGRLRHRSRVRVDTPDLALRGSNADGLLP